MKVTKKYEFSVSKVFPDNTIAVSKFGTILEEDSENISAEDLFYKAYQMTIMDIKEATKQDKVVKEIMHGLESTVKKAKKLRKG